MLVLTQKIIPEQKYPTRPSTSGLLRIADLSAYLDSGPRFSKVFGAHGQGQAGHEGRGVCVKDKKIPKIIRIDRFFFFNLPRFLDLDLRIRGTNHFTLNA